MSVFFDHSPSAAMLIEETTNSPFSANPSPSAQPKNRFIKKLLRFLLILYHALIMLWIPPIRHLSDNR